MHTPLERLHHSLDHALWRPLWQAIAGRTHANTPLAPMALPPDWQTPAYLRRRVSGDALACPWPPRQH